MLDKRPQPDFENLAAVLNKAHPSRPTLFEYALNDRLYVQLSGRKLGSNSTPLERLLQVIYAFYHAGYDYATVSSIKLQAFSFFTKEVEKEATVSLNAGALITDRQSFEAYPWHWPEPEQFQLLQAVEKKLPRGMKLVVSGPGGLLENVISLVGFENLAYLTIDDPELLDKIFRAVGERLVRYYEICASFPAVGALIINDDWGFKTGTILSPDDLHRYVFPWHRQMVEACHARGKYAILHSCGNVKAVFQDIITLGFDAKHSFEDNIWPIEEAYHTYHGRIAFLGGIDVDFLCRESPSRIATRSRELLEIADKWGGYALGSGNSIPEYVPAESYIAMVRAVLDYRE